MENPAGGTINTGGDVQAGFTGAGGTPNGLGLVYLRNRWYDPQTERFLTQDPMGLGGGLNLYAYAGNNPTSFSDPFGLCPTPDGKDDGKPCNITLHVQRLTVTSHSTMGRFTLSSNDPGAGLVSGATLEMPEGRDRKGHERIAPGTYVAHRNFGSMPYSALRLMGADRADPNPAHVNDILVHSGDYPRNTHGCILVGEAGGTDALARGTSVPKVNAIRSYIDRVRASDHGRMPNINVVVTNPPS